MELPEEVRDKIYNFIPQKEVGNLRLVSKQWLHEVDNLYNFDGIIDDESPHLERVLNLRLVSCTVISFYKNPPKYGLPGTTLFKYPHLLRTLNMNYRSLNPHASPANAYYLLSDYGCYLTKLSLYLNIPLLVAQFNNIEKINLQNLVKLELIASITLFTDIGNDPSAPLNNSMNEINGRLNTFDQLMRNPMPSLKRAKLEIRLAGGRTISKFMGSIFVFLASRHKCSGTIFEKLDLQLIQGHHGLPSAAAYAQDAPPLHENDLALIDWDGLYKLESMKHLRIVSSSSIGVGYWMDFIQRQTRLVSLEVDVIPANHQLFASVISNNYATLVHLEITDLTVWVVNGDMNAVGPEHQPEPVPFDVTILQPCISLKRLILDRNVIARREFECAELINLINLPNTLEELALNFFHVYTNDFYLYFSSLKLSPECKLTNVAITQCGSGGDYGVNGSVLELLISIGSVLFVEISRLNFGNDPNGDEAIKLNRLLTEFGYRENHSYFQYSKIQTILNEIEQIAE